MNSKIIIILASERSGTNLLRVLLGKHKEISAPVAAHFFNTFASTLKYYGDLNKKINSEKLINHFLKSANHSYTNWNLFFNSKQIIEKYNVKSFEGAFSAMYNEQALKEGKQHYVVKDNDMFNYVELTDKLKTKEHEVYYIHLYRDPRDQVVSWLKTPLFLHTPYDIGMKWDKEQSKIAEISKTHNVYRLSYEDLINNTELEMTKLLKYIDIEIDVNCFTTDSNNKESQRNELWENLSKPILRNNKKKYKNILKGKELKIVETICKKNMLQLGYRLDTKANWKDYFGIYTKKLLPKKRARSMKLNKKFYNDKMGELKSKLVLLESLKKEVVNEK